MTVEAVCVNPNDMRLKVTTEMTLAQWQALFAHMDKAGWHHIQDDFMRPIQEAIRQIEKREVLTPPKVKGHASD